MHGGESQPHAVRFLTSRDVSSDWAPVSATSFCMYSTVYGRSKLLVVTIMEWLMLEVTLLRLLGVQEGPHA